MEKKIIKIELTKQEMEWLSDLLIKDIHEMNRLEANHRDHLRNSFYQFRNKLVAINTDICKQL